MGDEFEVADILADGAVKLMAEGESGKIPGGALPVFGQGLEADVLREENTSQSRAAGEEIGIVKLRRAVFLRGEKVHAPAAKLVRDGGRHVDVEVKLRHATSPRRSASRRKRRGEGG